MCWWCANQWQLSWDSNILSERNNTRSSLKNTSYYCYKAQLQFAGWLKQHVRRTGFRGQRCLPGREGESCPGFWHLDKLLERSRCTALCLSPAQPHFQHHHHRCLHTKWLALTPVLPKIYCKKCFFAQKMTYKLQEGEYVKKKHCRHKPNFTPKIEWSLQLKAHMVRSVISLFWLSRKLSSRSWVRISVQQSSWWR